jgi:ferritin-like protein
MDRESPELDRRQLLKMGAGAAGVVAGALVIGCGGSAGLSTTGTATASTATGGSTGGTGGGFADSDYFNFLLNLEYIKAEYYLLGATGVGLQTSDSGPTPGTVNGGSIVSFVTPSVQNLMVNLATDELLHVRTLRGINGSSAVSMPSLDFTNGFTAMAAAAGVGTFNAFASEQNFLLGAYFFEDVAITAQYGIQSLMTSPTDMVTVGGIFGADSYHAGAIRYALFVEGSTSLQIASQISGLRSSLGGGADAPPAVTTGILNVAPHDTNGFIYARTTREVEDILYLSQTAALGAFFPAGFNGNIVSSLKRRR